MRPAPQPEQVNALEAKFYAAIDRAGLSGYERQPRTVAGYPDAYFRHVRPRPVAVFIDGCQTHFCAKHFRPGAPGPDPDKPHRMSIDGGQRQRLMDSRIRRALAASGIQVLAFWEHDVNANLADCVKQVAAAVKG